MCQSLPFPRNSMTQCKAGRSFMHIGSQSITKAARDANTKVAGPSLLTYALKSFVIHVKMLRWFFLSLLRFCALHSSVLVKASEIDFPVLQAGFCSVPAAKPENCEALNEANSSSRLNFGDLNAIFFYDATESRPITASCTSSEPLRWVLQTNTVKFGHDGHEDLK